MRQAPIAVATLAATLLLSPPALAQQSPGTQPAPAQAQAGSAVGPAAKVVDRNTQPSVDLTKAPRPPVDLDACRTAAGCKDAFPKPGTQGQGSG